MSRVLRYRATVSFESGNEISCFSAETELSERRLELWADAQLINELMNKFHWRFEWLVEKIPVTDPKFPPSTTEFMSTLCEDCYFELKVSANGAPHFETVRETLVLSK
jgi:hypothetical protein